MQSLSSNPDTFEWSDLQYLLAVARHGSTLGAGRALGVNQSTVQRRLGELERRIGQPLVKRHPTGYRLTDFGEQLLPYAQRVEEAVFAVQAQVRHARLDVTGVVRLACAGPLVARLRTSALLERFAAKYPGLRVDLVAGDQNLDLTRGDADIALRADGAGDDALFGRKICQSTWSVFASREYVAKHCLPKNEADLAQHTLVGLDDTMARHPAAVWLLQVAPQAVYAARGDSVADLLVSVKAAMGVAPLPDLLGDAEPGLVRAFGPVPALARTWKILTPGTLRDAPRVKALFEFLVNEADELASLLT